MTVAELRAILSTQDDDAKVLIDIDNVNVGIKGTGNIAHIDKKFFIIIPHTDATDEQTKQRFREMRDKVFVILDEYSKEYRKPSSRCLIDISNR